LLWYSIGVVVDDAIVVIEAVHAKMEEEHLSPLKATKKAMHEIAGAIIAITFLMAAVLFQLPLYVWSREFYRQFATRWQLQSFFQGSWH
jgi:HAE1 family hydrophobic/amphiphilic exporter-1